MRDSLELAAMIPANQVEAYKQQQQEYQKQWVLAIFPAWVVDRQPAGSYHAVV